MMLIEPFLAHSDSRLAEADYADISAYLELLILWNARVNLTAVRDPEEMVSRHFGESVFAAVQLFPGRSVTPNPESPRLAAADLGSGAGFPGIPIKLWARDLSMSLIESNQKKATFLREVTRALKLPGVQVENSRAETLPPGSSDLVTLRAVERFAEALPIAAQLVRPGGRIALLISSSQVPAAQTGLSGIDWFAPITIPLSQSRVLLIGRK